MPFSISIPPRPAELLGEFEWESLPNSRFLASNMSIFCVQMDRAAGTVYSNIGWRPLYRLYHAGGESSLSLSIRNNKMKKKKHNTISDDLSLNLRIPYLDSIFTGHCHHCIDKYFYMLIIINEHENARSHFTHRVSWERAAYVRACHSYFHHLMQCVKCVRLSRRMLVLWHTNRHSRIWSLPALAKQRGRRKNQNWIEPNGAPNCEHGKSSSVLIIDIMMSNQSWNISMLYYDRVCALAFGLIVTSFSFALAVLTTCRASRRASIPLNRCIMNEMCKARKISSLIIV